MYKFKILQAGWIPWEHLSFVQNLLNFIITKYFKQVGDELNVCMDECSPFVFSITGDKDFIIVMWWKGNDVLFPVEKCPVNFCYRVAQIWYQ